jgi:predicted metalloendopeptidase
VDQNGLTLSRDFYINDTKASNKKVLNALKETIKNIAVLLGGSEKSALQQAEEIIEFEKKLANITVPKEDRRDESTIYHKLTVANLTEMAPFVNWKRYINRRLDIRWLP